MTIKLYQTRQQQLSEQAAQVDSYFRLQRRLVLDNGDLSLQGKKGRIDQLEAERVSKVAALQETAVKELADARAKHAKAAQEANRRAEEQQRAQLGDQVMLQLLERQLRRMPARDLVAFVNSSASEWQRTVTMHLAADIIDERAAGGPGKYVLIGDEPAHYLEMADAELRRLQYDARPADLAELEREGLELRQGDTWVESLDLDAQRRNLARFGISYDAAVAQADEQDRQARGV